MNYIAYEVKSYVNRLQGYNYQVSVKAVDLMSGEALSPSRISPITDDDILEFERRIGRQLLLTYTDVKMAEVAEICRLEFNVETGRLALIYHVVNKVEGTEWNYIEIYKFGKLDRVLKIEGALSEALKELGIETT